MTSRSRFTLDEARAAGERIGVDWALRRLISGSSAGEPYGALVCDDVPGW